MVTYVDKFLDASCLQPWISACRLRVRTEQLALADLKPMPANVQMVSMDTTVTRVC